MRRAIREIPPPLEMLCLKALWSLGKGNVREVQQLVGRTRTLAYTTIMTVLDRLVRKGKLTRHKVGRAYVYTIQASRESMCRAAVRELVEGFFDGSEAELIQFLSESAEPALEKRSSAAAEEPIDTVLL